MQHASPASASTAQIRDTSQRLGKLLRAFGETRSKAKLTADEALIYLAIGHLGMRTTSAGVVVRPVTCLDLAGLLNIPRETVRRKLAKLENLGLLATTSRGVLMQDAVEWSRLAEMMSFERAAV